MRGRPLSAALKQIWAGNTPAYAGKTPSGKERAWRCRKHPRVCGEDSQKPTGKQLALETPPRMRGRLFCLFNQVQFGRNTPAYAGTPVKKPNLICQ